MRKGLLIGIVVAVLLCGSWVNKDRAVETAAKWYEKSLSPWYKGTLIPIVKKAIDSIPGTIIQPDDQYSQKPGRGKQPTKGQQPPKSQVSTPQPPTPTKGELTEAVKERARLRMLELVNEERTKAGAKPLQYHKGAERVATLRAEDMVKRNYFSHVPPGETEADCLTDKGMTWAAILKREGISDAFGTSGENQAGASEVLPDFIERAHKNLMNSPGHRAAILDPDFTHVGIGIVKGCANEQGPGFPDGCTVVQIFLGKPKAKE